LEEAMRHSEPARSMRRVGLAVGLVVASTTFGFPKPPGMEGMLPPPGPIYNENVDAQLPHDLTAAERARVRYLLLKFPPVQRQYFHFIRNQSGLTIYWGAPGELWGDVTTSLDSNSLYDPSTGESEPGSAGGVAAGSPGEGPAKLNRVPAGWTLHAYVPTPKNAAPIADADVATYPPAGLTQPERTDVLDQLYELDASTRRQIRWDYPPPPPPRSAEPAFGFVVFRDDPNEPNAPNVCYENLAIASVWKQYWCPYYREVLVNPSPDVLTPNVRG
jgi:hypothetical protein